MALGMAKDSMVDLQSLVQGKLDSDKDGPEEGADTVTLLTTGQSRGSQLEYDKLLAVEPTTTGSVGSNNDDGSNSETARQAPPLEVIEDPIASAADEVGQTSTADEEEEEEEKKQDGVPGQYAGFANDYEDYNYDAYGHFQYHSSNAETLLGNQKQSGVGGFLCCLFPWFQKKQFNPAMIEDGDDDTLDDRDVDDKNSDKNMVDGESLTAVSTASKEKAPLRKNSSGGEEDDVSTGELSVGSDKLGERLSEKDRQAVLARLRLAQPDRSSGASSDDAASPTGSTKEKLKKGLLNDIPNITGSDHDVGDDVSQGSGPRGILKRQSVAPKQTKESQSDSASGGKRRRSLFPTVAYDAPKSKKNYNHVQFAPMARVVTVKSQKDMTPEEKSSVWWQKWDYDDFRKTGRIITRAMLEGGSEIWLASNQSWRHQGLSKSATLKNAMTLAEESAKNGSHKNGSNDTADLIQTTGDKWWHKFGHSRRGLEHIASIKEGAERQANVRHAIRAVLEEQKRHKAYMREDAEKLRMVSLHHTSWARDLAYAAGQSDADAVQREFDEERKSREFYLLKMARANSVSSKGKHVPAFMQPAMNTFARKLDANTSAQIMYRRKQERMLQQRETPVTGTPKAAPSKRASIPPSMGSTDNRSLEHVQDAGESQDEADKAENLAKRAAGFTYDDAEQVSMAAVLSGMGAVPKSATPVGA